jgi:hypothetical protein
LAIDFKKIAGIVMKYFSTILNTTMVVFGFYVLYYVHERG